jgi:hypothetical protein
MTQRQFNAEFKNQYPGYPHMTLTDRRVTYNDMMEHYRTEKLISEKQANNWGHPVFITQKKK